MIKAIERVGLKDEAQVLLPAIAARMNKMPFTEPCKLRLKNSQIRIIFSFPESSNFANVNLSQLRRSELSYSTFWMFVLRVTKISSYHKWAISQQCWAVQQVIATLKWNKKLHRSQVLCAESWALHQEITWKVLWWVWQPTWPISIRRFVRWPFVAWRMS